VLCGAISRPVAERFAQCGITLVPFLAGATDTVIDAFLMDQLARAEFAMPGCCRQRRRLRGENGARRGFGRCGTGNCGNREPGGLYRTEP